MNSSNVMDRERVPSTEIDAAAADARTGSGGNRTPVLLTIVAIVALGIGAAIGWLLGTSDDVATRNPAEVEQVVEDYVRAWEEQDTDGFRALLTDDFESIDRIYAALGDGYYTETGEAGASHLESLMFANRNDVRWHGDLVVVGDGPWFAFVIDTWAGDFLVEDGVSTFVVVEDGDTVKIANHTWVGTSHQPD